MKQISNIIALLTVLIPTTCLGQEQLGSKETAVATSADTTAQSDQSQAAAESLEHTSTVSKRQPIGWVERVRLHPENLLFEAKLTPGSEGNVLHAENIKEFKKGAENWIRFSLVDRKGVEQTIERKLIGKSTYRTADSGKQRRYLIESGICLNKTFFKIDFSLADRSEFEQKMRIGRETLAGHFLIDPAKTKTTRPRCKLSKNIE